MSGETQLERLLATVVDGGYCIGCGACAALSGSALRMRMDDQGRLQAGPADDATSDPEASSDLAYLAVCPFSGEHPDETQLARELFGSDVPWDERIGAWRRLWVGHVAEDGFRERGAAGGMGAWVLTELLERDVVDAVIHVVATPGEERLFRYRVSDSAQEVQEGSRSAYYPIELSEVLRTVRESPARYAVVGIPCFITAVRLLARSDPIVAERVRVCLGLFSGHLKSAAFADYLAWQAGIPPGHLRQIDFRTKLPDRPANRYGMTVTGDDGPVTRAMEGLDGHDWGMGYFKYRACDYCDDVAAETADIAIGDAWLPGYREDPAGTNVVIVRDTALVPLFEDAIVDGRLRLTPLTPDDVARSQTGAFRHRRDNLPDRLAAADERGTWRPPKRVAANEGTPGVHALNEARQQMRDASHAAWTEARRTGRLEAMQELMAEQVATYERLPRGGPSASVPRAGIRRAPAAPDAGLFRRIFRRPPARPRPPG